jgi:putative SOS response-associated peptidase YedK
LSTSIPDLADIFEASTDLEELPPRFNVAPTDSIPIILDRGRGRRIETFRWGLIPSRTGTPEGLPLMINARAESVDSRPSFRGLLAGRRCVVPADGFYEWRTEMGRRQPYFIRHRDRRPLAFAGLWDDWTGAGGTTRSCTIITTDANDLLRPLHDRMPVVLEPEALRRWLDPTLDDFDRLRDSLVPAPWKPLEAFPVSPRMNRVAEDDARCLEPLGPAIREPPDWAGRPTSGREPDQLALF